MQQVLQVLDIVQQLLYDLRERFHYEPGQWYPELTWQTPTD